MKAFLQHKSASAQLSIFLIIFGGFFVIGSVISLWLVSSVYSISMIDLGNIANNLNEARHIDILKTLQIIHAFFVFIISGITFSILCDRSPLSFLSMNKWFANKTLLSVIMASLFMIPFINFLAYINGLIDAPEWMVQSEAAAKLTSEAFVNTDLLKDLIINIIMIGLIAGIGEELIFRGILQKLLTQTMGNNHHLAILITAFLFSAIHMQFLSFLPRFILGIYLGYLFVWSGSLWLPIFTHFLNNTMAVLFYFFQTKYNLDPHFMDSIGTTKDTMIYTILSFIISIALFWIIRRQLKTT